jgi:WD40 repeat protein
VSAYERARLANIQRNLDFLDELGLNDEPLPLPRAKAAAGSAAARKRKREPRAPSVPQRQSRRLADKPAAVYAEGADVVVCGGVGGAGAGELGHSGEEWHEPVFGDSDVVSYLAASVGASDAAASAPPEVVTRVRLAGAAFEDEQLKKIYSLDWHGSLPLFAGGGHGGRAAVFGLDSGAPLMSFKVSKGWVSGVQFLPASPCRPAPSSVLLLSASNDGSLSLWDCGKQGAGKGGGAKCVASSSEAHSSGIFSVHCVGGSVGTGGKDGRVAVSRLIGAGAIETVLSFADEHASVVKSVRLRDEHTLASTGNDGRVCVFDLRAGALQLTVNNVSQLALNSVRWSPADEHVLAVAGFAPEIRLLDLRKPGACVELRSHHGPRARAAGRCAQIYHPLFLEGGRKLLTTGDDVNLLTLYDTTSGAVVSRGDVGFSASALALDRAQGRLLAAHGRTVAMLHVA